ncbi:Ubiquitin thioesterase otulin [Varanus komodoensis]|nr:Ubiquitin thioesterase otulin [Varanus komodoensis]
MITDKEDLFFVPRDDGKAALATGGAENKPPGQRAGPERPVRISAGGPVLTDSTKRCKLSSSQEPALHESPGMLQQMTKKAGAAVEEKPKRSIFSISFSKSKKEKCTAHDKGTSSFSSSHKGKPALPSREESASCAKRAETEDLKTSSHHQDHYHRNEGKLPDPAIFSPMESSVDYEEDMYRDAEEIEREKVLLVCGTGSSDFPENKLSVEPEVDIMDYCQEEWRGNTSHARCIRKGYKAVSQKFISIRRVRGDNYCAVRATLFQALAQTTQLPVWLQREDIMLLPEKLMNKYDWITQWQLRQKWTTKAENLMDEIKECLILLKMKWKNLSEMKSLSERQAACDKLFKSEDDEYRLYEAVKFLMLSTAIRLYEDNEKGKEVPVFSWLLFARDTSSNPSQLMENHLNQLGHTGGLEQVS